MNRKRNDYTALKRKLFGQILLLAGLALLFVLLFRVLSTGRIATGLVEMLGSWLHVDPITASKIYFFGIRNYLDVLLALAALLFFLLFFRAFLNRITAYLEEVSQALDKLDGGGEIALSPELAPMELRLKSLQQSMERKELQAQRDQQRRNDLLIYSAHDIKTPLTSALGYLTLLDGNPQMPEEERAKCTRIALEKTRELDCMLQELFEITRYNLHEIGLEKTWLNLYDMLWEIKEEYYPQLEAAKKQAEIAAEKDIRLLGDGEKLARVFSNLFKNALSYSEAGSTISLSAAQQGDLVEICFENRCRPLPQEKLERLFEPFYRGREKAGVSGSGLGLSIAREIVLLHGGSIRAENTEDGIRFQVQLPVG